MIHFFSTKGNFIEAEGDQFRLLHPIYRGLCREMFKLFLLFINLDAGRFGYGEFMDVQNPSRLKKNRKSFIRCLRLEYLQMKTIETDLEELLLIDHKLV